MEQQSQPPVKNHDLPGSPTRHDDLLGVIAEVEQQLEVLRAAQEERAQQRTRLQMWEEQLNQRHQALEEHAAQCAAEQSQLAEQRTALQQERAEFEQTREQAETQLRQLAAQHHEYDAEFERRQTALEMTARELQEREAALARREDALDKQEHQLAERMGRLSQYEEKLNSASSDAQELKSQLDQLGEQLANAQQQAAAHLEQEKAARAAADAARAQLEQREAELAQLRQRIEAQGEHAEEIHTLKTELQNARQQAALGDDVQQQLAEKEAQIETLRAQVEAAHARAAEFEQRMTAQADTASDIQRIAEQLHEREAHIQQLEAALAEYAASERHQNAQPVDPVRSQAVERRLNRLRLMRSLIREQHGKLRQAGEALRERHKEYEQVLAQRDQIARMKAGLAQLRKQSTEGDSKVAARRAIALACYVVLAVSALLGLSWAVSGQLAPANFAARAVLTIDGPRNEAGLDQLAEWQRYHQSLITDPSMMQFASERMGRHGIVSLSTPAHLSARLQEDLTVRSPYDGKLIVELRGSGGTRTARELEIYATALASQANSTRGRRADGLGTIIAEDAKAGEPVSDARLIYAGGIFGLGTGLAGFLGFAIWRRLSASKSQFEEELRTDSILDQANWSDEPQVLARPRY